VRGEHDDSRWLAVASVSSFYRNGRRALDHIVSLAEARHDRG
jgi:hypothetical protein